MKTHFTMEKPKNTSCNGKTCSPQLVVKRSSQNSKKLLPIFFIVTAIVTSGWPMGMSTNLLVSLFPHVF